MAIQRRFPTLVDDAIPAAEGLTEHYSTEFGSHPGAVLEMCVLQEHFETGLHIFWPISMHLGGGL